MIINEGFRLYDVQQAVINNLSELVQSDVTIRAGVEKSLWSISWFITKGVSNHQMGYAVDLSL